MAEPFDPTMIPALDPVAVDEDGATSIGEAMALTRQAFSGLEDLPIDAVTLPGDEETSPPVLDAPIPPGAILLPIDPAVIAPVPLPTPSPDIAAMQQRLALLESQLAAASLPAPASPAEPLRLSEEVVGRVAGRFQQAFASMAEMAEGETDAQFETRRAQAFAQTIVQAVYEDLLPTEAVQARFRPMAEQVADQRARQVFDASRQQAVAQDQQSTLIRDAVIAARTAGYDVYDPSDTRHATSKDSRLVWGVATQVDPNLPAAAQIQELLSLLPARQAAAVPAAPTQTSPARPQPMARQGNLPTPASGGEEGEGPASIDEMMRAHGRLRRIGAA